MSIRTVLCTIDLPMGERLRHIPLEPAEALAAAGLDEAAASAISVISLAVHEENEKKKNLLIGKGVKNITTANPDMVVIYLDNVIRSRLYYLGVAEKIARRVKACNRGILIGVVSRRIGREQGNFLRQYKSFDFAVTKNSGNVVAAIASGVSPGKAAATQAARFSDSSIYTTGKLDSFLRSDFPALLLTTRGCSNRCAYCYRSLARVKIEFLKVGVVMEDLKYVFSRGIKRCYLLDDNFLASMPHAESFASAYARTFGDNGPEIMVNCRPETISVEAVSLLRKINCRFVQTGIQSINSRVYGLFGRKCGSAELAKRLILLKSLERASVQTDLIAGLPGDDADWVKKSIDFLLKLRPQIIRIGQLYLNPGTAFSRYRRRFGLIAEKKKSDFNVPFVVRSRGFCSSDFDRLFADIKNISQREKDIHWEVSSYRGGYRVGPRCHFQQKIA